MRIKRLGFELWTDALQIINDFPNNSVNRIHRKIDCQYTHIYQLTRLLKEAHLIVVEQHGREIVMNTTVEGKKIAMCLKEIKKILGEQKKENEQQIDLNEIFDKINTDLRRNKNDKTKKSTFL